MRLAAQGNERSCTRDLGSSQSPPEVADLSLSAACLLKTALPQRHALSNMNDCSLKNTNNLHARRALRACRATATVNIRHTVVHAQGRRKRPARKVVRDPHTPRLKLQLWKKTRGNEFASAVASFDS